MEMRIVEGPWNEPLSRVAGRAVRLARPEHPGDPLTEPVTLMSDGSLARLEREAGRPVDPRRFRMLFTLSGCDAHEEDTWEGRLRAARRGGHSRHGPGRPLRRDDPRSRHGERDLDTLRLIKGYRGLRGKLHRLRDVRAGRDTRDGRRRATPSSRSRTPVSDPRNS